MQNELVMRTPASWHGDMGREGAPCGNGVVGALVYGGVDREIILLNHARLWHAGWQSPMPDVSGAVEEIRRHLDERRPDLAGPVFRRALADAGYDAHNCGPLPLCDLTIRRASRLPHRHYRRVVGMDRGEVEVRWEEDGVLFRRRTFVSRADGLVYTELSASEAGRISADLSLAVHDGESKESALVRDPRFSASLRREGSEGLVSFSADCFTTYAPASGRFGAVLRVIPAGGTVETAGDGSVRITGADSVLAAVRVFVSDSAEIDGDRYIRELDAAEPYEKALERHLPLHRRLYDRASLTLTEGESRSNEELLLEAFDSEMSPELAEKLWAFGRYLLICASDDGPDPDGNPPLPMSLVGLWLSSYTGMWAIHMFNVNFEMIYWNALSGNMPSLLRSALEYMERLTEDFRENARKLWGCRGIWINSVNTPESGKNACLADHIMNWTGAAAWLSALFRDYARYTGDSGWLREHALPFMREAALFYEDFLTEGEDGTLRFAPSVSPENVPRNVLRDLDSRSQAAVNAVMDVSLCRELLTGLCEDAGRCGMYGDEIPRWRDMLAKLPPYRINPDGSLAEWIDPFYEDENAHRHQSHLYGVFPGHEIREGSPLFPAYRLAEDKRRTEGLSSMSSWGLVWMAGTYARLRDGDRALSALSEMVRHCCMRNFFTVHNDWRRMGPAGCDDMRAAPLQLDAIAGFPAAVNEMLLDSSDGTLTLLPALPSGWKRGEVRGLSAVGGFTVSVRWDEGGAEAEIAGDGSVPVKPGGGFRFEDGKKERTASAPCTLRLIRDGV